MVIPERIWEKPFSCCEIKMAAAATAAAAADDDDKDTFKNIIFSVYLHVFYILHMWI